MTEQQITLKILSLGTGKILGAFKWALPHDSLPTTNPNAFCARALAKLVVDGVITLEDIQAAPVHVPVPTKAALAAPSSPRMPIVLAIQWSPLQMY